MTAGAVRGTKAFVGSFEVQLISFPPRHRIPAFDFDRGYHVVVLEGSVAKTFGRSEWSLSRDSFASLPEGATHTSAFGRAPTRVVAIRGGCRENASAVGAVRLRHVRAAAATALGWRLAGELRAYDPSWALAAEGLVLQLLALAGRAGHDARPRAPWLQDVRDLLHERVPEQPTLGELAVVAGVHPVHVARCFRREYGLTVAQYARSLRLDWAARRLLTRDATLAQVAAEAGFADQSHFTRSFRRYAGVTPGKYRELLRREGPGAGAPPPPVAP